MSCLKVVVVACILGAMMSMCTLGALFYTNAGTEFLAKKVGSSLRGKGSKSITVSLDDMVKVKAEQSVQAAEKVEQMHQEEEEEAAPRAMKLIEDSNFVQIPKLTVPKFDLKKANYRFFNKLNDGKCTAEDKTIIMSLKFKEKMVKCGLGCYASDNKMACIEDCMVAQTGLSKDCADCVGTGYTCMSACSRNECLADPESTACNQCKQKCINTEMKCLDLNPFKVIPHGVTLGSKMVTFKNNENLKDGKCTPDDLSKFAGDHLKEVLVQCALSCGKSDEKVACMEQCVVAKLGLSQPCAQCLGDGFKCAMNCAKSEACVNQPFSQQCLQCEETCVEMEKSCIVGPNPFFMNANEKLGSKSVVKHLPGFRSNYQMRSPKFSKVTNHFLRKEMYTYLPKGETCSASKSCYGAKGESVCCNNCRAVHDAYVEKNWKFEPATIAQCQEVESEAHHQCGVHSCYGAKEKGCCQTCNDVVDAYKAKGWSFDKKDFGQCMKEMDSLMLQKSMKPLKGMVNFDFSKAFRYKSFQKAYGNMKQQNNVSEALKNHKEHSIESIYV